MPYIKKLIRKDFRKDFVELITGCPKTLTKSALINRLGNQKKLETKKKLYSLCQFVLERVDLSKIR